MHVNWAVTCRYAESDGASGTIVGAGVDVLFVPEFPHQVGIMLAVRLAATLEEIEGESQELEVRIEGPDGGPVRGPDGAETPTLRVQFQLQGEQLVPGWLVSPLFTLALQWNAAEEGTYTIVVGTGAGEPSRSPVHVLPDSRRPQ